MSEQKKTAVDGIIVLMTWHCAICKQNWQQYIDQGTVRRMPSYVSVRGQRIETRRPDGSMLRAHEECADRMLRYMEANEVRREERKKKNRIIEAGE
jgi:hypothetical protein